MKNFKLLQPKIIYINNMTHIKRVNEMVGMADHKMDLIKKDADTFFSLNKSMKNEFYEFVNIALGLGYNITTRMKDNDTLTITMSKKYDVPKFSFDLYKDLTRRGSKYGYASKIYSIMEDSAELLDLYDLLDALNEK